MKINKPKQKIKFSTFWGKTPWLCWYKKPKWWGQDRG